MSERILLLVDDEENILRALMRLLRRDGYTILTANSGPQGLELLQQHEVGVILSDQRMPGMMGSEFLEQAKALRPQTVRLMLSGYTDLQSVTDAINRGSIYKFLTKPWDDDLLRENVRNAFEHYELRAERDRLAEQLREANERLGALNAELSQRVTSQSAELDLHHRMLELSREVLEQLPVGVIGIGEDGLIALANCAAHDLLHRDVGSMLGGDAGVLLAARMQEECMESKAQGARIRHRVQLDENGPYVVVHCAPLGGQSSSRGSMLVLVPEE